MALSTDQYGYLIDPLVPITDDKGTTIKDGFLRVYIAGSSTPVITYRNFDGAVNEKTIELDNSGRCKYPVIVNKSLAYKVVVYDEQHSQETPIITVDKMFAIGASVTAGAGSTVVQGLDGLTTKPSGFVDASVVGTDGYVAIDHTLVTDDLDTDAKVTAVENDRYIPLLNNDVNDPDSKIKLNRLKQWFHSGIFEEVNDLTEAVDFNADDELLVVSPNSTRKMLWTTLANKVLGFIKSLSTTITAFRIGDVIPVDGPSGTAKMTKDDLLKETAENALGSIHSLSDTATEADLVAGNFLAIDVPGDGGSTKKMPGDLVRGAKQIKTDDNGEFVFVIADKDGNVLGYVDADGFFRHFTKDVFEFLDIRYIGSLGEQAKKALALACNIEIGEGDFVRVVSDKNGFVLETISPDGLRKYYTKDAFSFLDLAPGGVFGDTLKVKILELMAEGRTIIVDKNGGGDFTTITAAIRSIAGDSTPKTIKIMAGVYDMFEEIGGDAFIASLPPDIQTSDWSTYCDIIPTNTKIIGVGNVTINFKMPDTISVLVSNVFAPLNCRGSVDFENLEINAENCRYGIHDESSGGAEYIGAVKHYKNVTINRTGDSSLGASCLGVGYSKNTTFVFDNCTFKHENKSPVYMHTWAATEDYSSIVFNNCVFISPSGTNNAIFEATTIDSSSKITASLNNCYCSLSQVRLVAHSKTCYIQLNAMKSGITTHTRDYSSLAYTPNYYN